MVTLPGMSKHPDSLIVDRLDGNAAVAKMFRISSQAVSKWRNTGIPGARRMYLEATRPEVFADIDAAPDNLTEEAA